MDIQALLEISCRDHTHLCPRQVLGVRIGLAGLRSLGYDEAPGNKRLLTIVESDGCFADGVTAATACTMGHRTLRVEDYGKVAATVVDVRTGRAVRVAPALDAREKAVRWMPGEPRHYFAQLKAYQVMPDEELLAIVEVELEVPVADLISRPAVWVTCELCGEEIINEREVVEGGKVLCRSCAGRSYYYSASRSAVRPNP